MALANSPKIVTDGLVYYHDSNNKKSYFGPPIQNLAKSTITYPQLATGISITGGTEIVDIPQLGPTNTYYTYIQNNYTSYTPNSTACCVQLIGGWGGFAVSPSTTYTYGIVYKCDSGYTSPNYMYRYEFTANGGTLVTEGGIHNNSNRVALGEGWYWAWGTFTTGATTNWISNAAMFYYQYSPFVDKVSVAKVLISPGNYTTMHPKYWPEQNTTRTNTQVLSDLTGLNSITATNLTYAGDGTFSYDGVDDYTTNSILCNKTYYSVNWWMNPVTRTNYNQTIGFNTNNTQTWGAFLFHTSATGQIYIGTTGLDTDRMTPTDLPANTLIAAEWQNFCWTFDNGTAKFYKNGTLLATKSLPLSTLSSFTSFTLGTSNSTTINGKISSVQIYSNKVLTAAEVQQNYNALRGRYGL